MGFMSVHDQWEMGKQAIEQAKQDAIEGGGVDRGGKGEASALQGPNAAAPSIKKPLAAGEGLDKLQSSSLSDAQMAKGFQRVGGETAKYNPVREGYGFRMSDKSFEEAEAGKAQLEKDIAAWNAQATKQIQAAQGTYNEQKGSFDAQVKSTQSELDAARKTLGNTPTQKEVFNDFWSSDLMTITLLDADGNKYSTHKIPRAVVSSWRKSTGTIMDFQGGGKAFVPMFGQPGSPKDILNSATAYSNKNYMYDEFLKTEEWNKSYRDALGAHASATNELNKAESAFNTATAESAGALNKMNFQIQQAEKDKNMEIEKAYGTRQAQVDAIREEYEAASQQAQLAYGNLAQKGGYQTPNE